VPGIGMFSARGLFCGCASRTQLSFCCCCLLMLLEL
jgi:hypothetical protein